MHRAAAIRLAALALFNLLTQDACTKSGRNITGMASAMALRPKADAADAAAAGTVFAAASAAAVGLLLRVVGVYCGCLLSLPTATTTRGNQSHNYA